MDDKVHSKPADCLTLAELDAPESGLKFYNLSARWGHGMPEWPSTNGAINVHVLQSHARDSIYVTEFEGIMHRGTHMDAPVHVTANTPGLEGYPLWRFFGTGVAVSIPKGEWEVITAEDLARVRPTIQRGDIVMINTGYHHKFADAEDYFLYSPGLYKEGAEWLVERGVKLVGIDVQANDHPLGTKLIDHGPGPSHPELMEEYKRRTGRDAMQDFPYWEAAHKTLMVKAGIPAIENVGGDLDAVTGKRCTFMAFPWRWPGGDGCPIRIVAVIDPQQRYRIGHGR